MSDDPAVVADHIRRRKAGKRAYDRRRAITDPSGVSDVFVTKNRRSVRITVITHLDKLHNRPPDLQPGTGFADLSDDQVDKLIRRLTNIRGGRRAGARPAVL